MEDNINNTNNSASVNPLPGQPAAPMTAPVSRRPMSPFTYVKRTIYILFGIVCLFGVWSTISSYLPTKTQSGGVISPSNSPTNTVTWKTFINKKYNYSVKYPDNLEMSQDTPYSTVYQVKVRAHIGFPSLYVSVIPDGFNNKGDVYNFMTADVINSFFTMHDNEIKQTETGENAQYWTFKRLAGIQVAETDGIMIENDNVWQSEAGLKNRRVLVKKNGVAYIIGSYYSTQQELNDFHNFLLSFKFL